MDSTKTNNKTVLLIEDDYYISDIYKSLLSAANYEVITSVDGLDGEYRALTIKPDLILLDIMIPLQNGLIVLAKLKNNPSTKNIPIILITNLGQRDIIEEAFLKGAQGFILKARVEPEKLIETVNFFVKNPTFKMDINNFSID